MLRRRAGPAAAAWQQPSSGGISGSLFGPTFGLILSVYDPRQLTVAVQGNAQRLYLNLVQAQENANVTTLGGFMCHVGVTAGPGINGFGLFSLTGTLLANTGDMTTAFSSVSVGIEAAASITSTPVTAGTYYYLGWVQNFTGTGMSLYGIQNASGITLNGYNSQLIQLSGYTSWASVTIGSLYVDAGSSGALHMHAR